jgi:hypothetical protein
MARLTKFLFLLVFSTFFASCVSVPPIVANKDTANLKPLVRVVVLLNIPDVRLHFFGGYGSITSYLQHNIEKALVQRSVEAKTIVRTGLELNADILKKEIEDFGAGVIMLIELDNALVVNDLVNMVLTSGDFMVSLVDTQLNKTVWKSKTHVEGPVVQSTLKEMIDRVFAEMNTDGLFKTPVSANT